MKHDQIDELQRDWAAQRPELDTEAMAIILRIQRLERRFSGQAAECLEDYGLAWWQYDVLSALRRQPPPHELPATELAAESMLTTGAMSHRINRLQLLGWLYRRHSPADGRKVLVGLTSAGRGLVDRATRARFEVAERALSGVTARQRKQLSGLLRRCILLLDDGGR